MGERKPVTPAEFTKRTEEGQSAGPGSPETDHPRTGRPGAGGHGPAEGPGSTGFEPGTPPEPSPQQPSGDEDPDRD